MEKKNPNVSKRDMIMTNDNGLWNCFFIFFFHSFVAAPLTSYSPKNHHSLSFFQAQILLDCGEDNVCVPDLKLAVHG